MKISIDVDDDVIEWLKTKTMAVGSPLEKLASQILEAHHDQSPCTHCGGTGRIDGFQCACGANPKQDDYPHLGYEVYQDVTITPSPDPSAFKGYIERKRSSKQEDEGD